MTYIQAVIAPDWVVLASDRRITKTLREGLVEQLLSQEDSATKSVIIDQRYVMGFAGWGAVDGQPMEEFIGDAVYSAPRGTNMFDALGERITEVFVSKDITCDRDTHTFIAAGFYQDPNTYEYQPELYILSNHLSGDARVFLSFARYPQEFYGERYVLSSNSDEPERAYASIGGRRNPDRDSRVRHELARLPAGDDPNYVINVLINAQHEAAEESNGAIGKSTLLTWIPRAALPLSVLPPDESEYTGPQFLKDHEFTIFLTDPDVEGPSSGLVYRPARYSRFAQLSGIVFDPLGSPGGEITDLSSSGKV